MVARGWDLPAVVGADALTVGPEDVRDASGTRLFGPGDVITIDGTTGAVWPGDAGEAAGTTTAESDEDILARLLPQLDLLERWNRDTGR